jgi:hypothetical protein
LRNSVNVTAIGDIINASGIFRLGRRVNGSNNPALHTSLASFRIATNSLLPEQIEVIYRDENVMMYDDGIRYFLPVDGAIAPTYVSDMDYDPKTGNLALAHEGGLWVVNNHVLIMSKSTDLDKVAISGNSDIQAALTDDPSGENAIYPITATTKAIAIKDTMIAAATLGGLYVKVDPKLIKSELMQSSNFVDNRTDETTPIEFNVGTVGAGINTLGGIPIAENSIMLLDASITALDYDNDGTEAAFFKRTLMVYKKLNQNPRVLIQPNGEE